MDDSLQRKGSSYRVDLYCLRGKYSEMDYLSKKIDSDVGNNLLTNLSIGSRSIFVKGHSNRLRSKGTCMNSDSTANGYNSGE